MSFKSKPIDELIRIVAAGGGLRMHIGSRDTGELIELARAAQKGGSVLLLTGLSSRDTADLVEIAQAGRGAVIFEDNPTIPFVSDGHQKY